MPFDTSPHRAKHEGLVIRTVPFKEADLIVHLFTRETGRVHAIARGARKSKRRFSGGLDLFDVGTFQLEKKHEDADLWIVTEFDRTEVWLGLRKSLLAFALASITVDLISVFAHPGDETVAMSYPALLDTLRFLNSASGESELSIRATCAFTLRLLLDSGLDPLASDLLKPGTTTYLRALREDRLGAADAGVADFARVQDVLKDLLNFVERTSGATLQSRRQLPKNLASLGESA